MQIRGLILIKTKCYILLNEYIKILYQNSHILNMKKFNHTE